MKNIIIFFLTFFCFLLVTDSSLAVYEPASVPNNKYGIHILFPEEIGEAAALVNSTGGDWGYVTVPIRASDKNLKRWQTFMDECRKHHLIPIIRIATEGDYFEEGSWEIPSKYYVIDFANFLNSLNWPTQNRYVIIFNEQNRGDEWGGTPDPVAYADILDYTVEIFKGRSDKFFIIFGGLDNAAPNVFGQYIDHLTYLRMVEEANPGIFEKIDGLSVHAYPNPGFASPPSYSAANSIYSYSYVNEVVKSISGKTLPIFITETGWSTTKVSYSTQARYYKTAFENAWADPSIVAVTPFLLLANAAPFDQFSFMKNGEKTEVYKTYQGFSKIKGQPKIEKEARKKSDLIDVQRIKDFSENVRSSFKIIDNQAKFLFKWLLNF